MSENTNNKMNGKKIVILIAVLVVLIGAVALCYAKFSPKANNSKKDNTNSEVVTNQSEEDTTTDESEAEGAATITIEVTDDQNATVSYEVKTDSEFLRGAMEELAASDDTFTFDGTESDYGLMIETMNGVTADYNTNGAYWAIYVNGEYGNYGIDDQPVADGDTYTFTYTAE